ncbi:MAG: CRISPR-associated helicase Cas3' [Austwickia sp.]|nr:CRISPR-associated helicase Cas3' [Actinomycetota bacterium]MCB1254515.1 CRISPR-associated helicase Cas3' [Austwickia sp.]MCO5309615.1 CRISPR-associated helicase Cas3' [Austwickia sp.]
MTEHNWRTPLVVLWGKTGDGDTWLPLWQHLEDAAAVAGLLWDHWLPDSAKDHIAAALPGGHDDGRILLTWLAGVHDIGKATPAFQIKADRTSRHLSDRVRDAGFDLNVPLSEAHRAPHGALSHVLLVHWLTIRFGLSGRLPRRAARALAALVGAHHGVLPSVTDRQRLENATSYRGRSPLWEVARRELLDGMAEATGAASRLPSWLERPLPPTVQSLLAAAVVVADWLASDAARFPYVDRPSGPPTWDQLGLPRPWRASQPPRDAAALLRERFPTLAGLPGYAPTPIQRTAVEAAWAADRPPLILLEAEMGSGKTEAGLATAQVLAHRFGQGGVFIALPTMATSDAMFARVRSWIDQLPATGEHADLALFLAHGKAGLNDDYRGLPQDDQVAEVYDDAAGHRNDKALRHAVAVVNSWTRGRRRGLLAPFVVGTIDQVLFGALRSKHLPLRHLAIAGKVVVIDEVHSADTYMREYLRSILAWLGAYGTPVVLMSATLPPAQRAELLNAYAQGAAQCPTPGPTLSTYELIEPSGYPRTMLLDSTLREIPTEQTSQRPRQVTIEEHPDELHDLAARLREDLVDGGCVAIIRNTVARAQETWRALREALPEVEVVLAHSRFLAVDRARREADLRTRLGRTSSVSIGTRPHRLIVVGTQVLEQSLDIDVDLMVSDLCPVDLLLQRMGRLHRHPRGAGESDRPPRLRAPRLLLTGAEWSSTPVVAVSGSRKVYGEAALLAAAATLRRHGLSIRLPEDIAPLVDAAYDSEFTPPTGWDQRWAAAEAAQSQRDLRAQSRAKDFRLSGFGASEPLLKGGGLLADCGFFDPGDPDDSNGGRSQVRDSEDSLEVIVVRRLGTAIRPMPGVGLPDDLDLNPNFPPEPRIARALAGCTVRLPAWTTVANLDAVIAALEDDAGFAGWQQDCPWLQGQLVLALDEDGHARVADLDLSYDPDVGLTVTTHREES